MRSILFMFPFVAAFFLGCDQSEDSNPVPTNASPNAVSNPAPPNGTTGLQTSLALSWSCSDPENDPLTYDVYVDNTNPPTESMFASLAGTTVALNGLIENTSYYWKVIARDNHNNASASPIWQFATAGSTDTPNYEIYVDARDNCVFLDSSPSARLNITAG